MENGREKLLAAGLLWLRVLMGLGISYHGAGKVFGGMGHFSEMLANMGFPLPLLFAWLSAISEFGGGILIVLGLGTRIAALFVFINMFVAAFMFHGGDPLRAKELALAYLTVAGALVATGAGPISLDSLFRRYFRARGRETSTQK